MIVRNLENTFNINLYVQKGVTRNYFDIFLCLFSMGDYFINVNII